VVEAVPLEDDLAALDLDLLDDPLDEPSVDRSADRREVGAELVVDRDQRRPAP
jgi:hypothetical protein